MPDRNAAARSLLSAACWLALFLVVAKTAASELPWWPGLPTRLVTVVAASFSDVLFALTAGFAAAATVFAFGRGRRLTTTIVHAAGMTLFAVCAAYAVVALGVFRYFHRPLTYELLGLIGNLAAVRSSIAAQLTWPIALALLGAPTLFLLLAFRFPMSRRVTAVAMAFCLGWIASGWLLHQSGWMARGLEALWLSPHAELIRTTARALSGGGRPVLPADFPPGYVDEFRSFGARTVPAGSSFQLPADVPRPRNAIVVVLESVGSKYLALYGHGEEFMPNLTAEAGRALVFENIYAHGSFTYASFRPLNFSVYPGLPWHYALLEDGRPLPKTLAAAMRARGSRTGYFTSGDLDWSDQRWLLENRSGFETLEGAADLGCPLLSSWGAEDRCVFDRLLHWIGDDRAKPFFAVCWTDQTHDPYLPSAGGAAIDRTATKPELPFAADLSRYLSNLRAVDAQLGRLFAALRERGLADDTLVVVTGDHGEAFADPHSQRGHAWSVFEEEVHVPLLLWNPRLFPHGDRVATIGGQVDLNPTLADLLGVEPPREWQGHSLFDVGRPPRVFFMAIAGGDVFGVREANWKYIYNAASGRESLFDLAGDPREQQDAAAREPERCTELRRRVAAWVSFEDAFLAGRTN
ncbi:MAG: sulfatase family protein [Chthoniobacterales bacterium]